MTWVKVSTWRCVLNYLSKFHLKVCPAVGAIHNGVLAGATPIVKSRAPDAVAKPEIISTQCVYVWLKSFAKPNIGHVPPASNSDVLLLTRRR